LRARRAAAAGERTCRGPCPVSAVPREASTLVLMRDPGAEVLMVQRHGQDSFAGGAYVFPGGVLEDADCSDPALALCGPEAIHHAAARLGLEGEPERALGYYLAAIRETFEEIGVLLAKPSSGSRGPDPETLQAARNRAQGDARAFWSWLEGSGLRPAVEDLTYFAHWITPAARPKRFDTRFFLASAPRDIHAEPDRKEIVDWRWIAPFDAMEAERAGRMRMVNATVKNLELLSEFGSAAEAREGLRKREVAAILPKLVPQGEGYRIVHPWEPGYDRA